MSELDQRLAMRFIEEKLAKEYGTDPVVSQCLSAAHHGDVSIEDALVKCIQVLVEQKEEMDKRLMDHEWERPTIIHMTDGKVLQFDPRRVREERSNERKG